MVATELSYLLSELVVCKDSYTGERQGLGDVETGGMGFLGGGRDGERLGVITTVRFYGNS